MLSFVCFFIFLIPLCFFPGFWCLIFSLLFAVSFVYLFPFLIFLLGQFGLFFGCNLISYGVILLSLWICVLIIMTKITVIKFKLKLL
jgi:NADH-ubiquinone oxidoreductase chain 4